MIVGREPVEQYVAIPADLLSTFTTLASLRVMPARHVYAQVWEIVFVGLVRFVTVDANATISRAYHELALKPWRIGVFEEAYKMSFALGGKDAELEFVRQMDLIAKGIER